MKADARQPERRLNRPPESFGDAPTGPGVGVILASSLAPFETLDFPLVKHHYVRAAPNPAMTKLTVNELPD